MGLKKKRKFILFSRYVDEGERVLDVAHKHVLMLKLNSAKSTFFGILIPIFLYSLFPGGIFFWTIWVLIGLGAMFYYFIDWYFDVLILTNVGVIDLERNGFFHFSSTRVDYHMIEGISYSIKGFWATVFQYGDVIVDKQGSKTSVVLHDAADPKKVERKIVAYQEKYISEKSIKDHHTLKGMLAEMIAYHVQNGKVKP